MNDTPERIWVLPVTYKGDDENTTGTWGDWYVSSGVAYIRADLVAAMVRDAVQAEREACAVLVCF